MSRNKIKINLPDDIKISAINFDRFNENPHLLVNHKWDELPIGKVVEIKKSYKGLMFKPIFHNLTDESKYLNYLHKKGLIINAQLGGMIERDKDGNIKQYEIYEISLCTL